MIVMDKQTKEWRGVLIDWDMCLLLEKREKHFQKTGTWGFISARILQACSSEPVMHSLGDDMESIFWVLVYQVLRYTRHRDSPCQLYHKMDRLFNDSVTTENNEVIGGSVKRVTILDCSVGNVDKALGNFQVTDLVDVFTIICEQFQSHYPHGPRKGRMRDFLKIQPTAATVSTVQVDWDSPDEKWFSTLLRQAAEFMQPLGITPTAIESPSNDSKPPIDPTIWKRAEISRYPPDYFEMPWWKDKTNSTTANENSYSKIVTSSRLNHIDGLSASLRKRPLEVDYGNDNNDDGRMRDGDAIARAKRQRQR